MSYNLIFIFENCYYVSYCNGTAARVHRGVEKDSAEPLVGWGGGA